MAEVWLLERPPGEAIAEVSDGMVAQIQVPNNVSCDGHLQGEGRAVCASAQHCVGIGDVSQVLWAEDADQRSEVGGGIAET
ncbi:MAG TPA: hypothetical protein VFS93_06370, partial [Terrimesophilobacter sp.]|nr:hypothetical protein [Terrimesophilobacter sp.]